MIAVAIILSALQAAPVLPAGKTAPAQPERQNPLRPNERAAVRAMGACVVNRWPKAARSFVLANNDKEAGIFLRRMNLPDCMPPELLRRSNEVSFRGFAFAGMLAERLIRAEFKAESDHFLAKAPSAEPDTPQTNATMNAVEADSLRGEWAIRKVAECAIRADTTGARALITSEVGPQENAAIAKLVPVVADCMPPKSETRFDRDSLRALIALSFYRLANAAGVLASSTK